mmetsp:Transcript_72981/g.147759  ORF Transcript_72981/g.147759 Transcript_72981/m.147759 type:complete len:230 (+) Transcript_72981:1843-2532(+)
MLHRLHKHRQHKQHRHFKQHNRHSRLPRRQRLNAQHKPRKPRRQRKRHKRRTRHRPQESGWQSVRHGTRPLLQRRGLEQSPGSPAHRLALNLLAVWLRIRLRYGKPLMLQRELSLARHRLQFQSPAPQRRSMCSRRARQGGPRRWKELQTPAFGPRWAVRSTSVRTMTCSASSGLRECHALIVDLLHPWISVRPAEVVVAAVRRFLMNLSRSSNAHCTRALPRPPSRRI